MQWKNDGVRIALWGLSSFIGAILWAILVYNSWPNDAFVLFEMIIAASFCGEGFRLVAIRSNWLSVFDEYELKVGKTYGHYERAWRMTLAPHAVLLYGTVLIFFTSINIALNTEDVPLSLIGSLWISWVIISIALIRESRSKASIVATERFDSQAGISIA